MPKYEFVSALQEKATRRVGQTLQESNRPCHSEVRSMPLPASPSFVAQTLNERIAEQLRQQVTQGEFPPGQRLSEQVLSENLGIARNTLREVFRTLAKDGLLRHEPNRGVFVVVPSIAAVIDIYRVRRLIECQALAEAYPRHPAKKNMRAAAEQAQRARDAGDWLAVGTANKDFHTAVVELADSERLNAMFRRILAELRLTFGLLQDAEFLHEPYVDMNFQILELVERNEMAKARDAMLEYLIHSERIVLAVYARRPSQEG